MAESQNQNPYSQTLVIDADQFVFDTIEEQNGVATVVGFRVDNPEVKPGDVLLILAESEIHFHGLIGKIEDGYAIASDRRGSLLSSVVH